MNGHTSAELLCHWVCLVLIISSRSVESLNWTVQPANPTEVTSGQDVLLTWSYSLTAAELLSSNTLYSIDWLKFNTSSSAYDKIATVVKFNGVFSYTEPNAQHIAVGKPVESGSATLKIIDVRRDDEGLYKIEYTLFSGKIADHEVNLTVKVPSKIHNVSSDQDFCEGAMVTLSCNATGKPTPNITWTRAFDNGTDSAPLLPVLDGKYVIKNITRNKKGTYRCTADNGVGDPVNRTVRVMVIYSASVVKIVNSSNTVNEGGSFNMTCEKSGDPEPNVHWIKVGNNGQRINGSILNFTNIDRIDAGQYRCEADNDCGSGSKVQSIDVYYPPNITNISENRTVNQSEKVNLTCTPDGNPQPSKAWTRVSNNQIVDVPLTITGKQDEGGYRCTADNGVGVPATAEVFITVQNFGPFGTLMTTNLSDNTAALNTAFILNCSAQANPPAKYRFYREQRSLFNTPASSYFAVTTTSVSDRINDVKFSCTPFNGYGDGSSATIKVKVHYAPSVYPKVAELNITKGRTARYECPVVGNPPPNITWFEGNSISDSKHSSGKELTIEDLQLDKSYTCLASNSLGTDTGIVHFVVVEKSSPNEIMSVIKITLTISNKNCETFDETKFRDMILRLYKEDGITEVIVKERRCGSVTLDLELHYTKAVSESEVITSLKEDATQNGFDEFKVDPDSIKRTEKEPSCKESFFKDAKCELKVLMVAIIAVCGVLVIGVIGGATYCWVRKRRKCRKDPRIHNSDDQEALQSNQSGVDENAYSRVNGGYADSGPPSANGTRDAEQQQEAGANGTDAPVQHQQQEQVQGAPPTYAVVDKSTKKKKKKEEEKRKKEEEKRRKEEEKKKKNEAEQNIPQYAVVDKSQKKKKEVVEDAYAEVNMSKKSKKKPKPGDVLYADLGDFQPKQMPAVSTSPVPLPPVKRPPAYQETQYADITQFLKGDATLPDANNSQGTEMTYANVEGGKETPNENANEEKPKDTANAGGNEEKPKETPL